MDLIEFLRARIDEDEQVARAVSDLGDDKVHVTRVHESDDLDPVRSHWEDAERTRLLARYDPARVLADVDAKRQIVHDYEARLYAIRQHPSDRLERDANVLLHPLRSLAAIYADHPDYREEWKP